MKNLLLVILIFLFACKKHNSPTVPMQLSDMPIKEGNSWSYAVTNYPPTETDTAVFQISQASSVFNGVVTYYTTTSIKGAIVDSGIITVNSSDVNYIGANGIQTFAGSGLFDNWILPFPISADSGWAGTNLGISIIGADQSITIAGNNYKHVYTLKRTFLTPGGNSNDTLMIVPKVGIVQWHGFPLVSYHLQ